MEGIFMKIHRTPPHDIITEAAFGGLDNWDSEYFIYIAQHGYREIEQSMAFFPLYPLLIHALSNTVFYPLSFFISYRSVALISGVAVNFIAFPFATSALYLLTHEITQNRRLSFLAAALFCINPASVFMTAVYTECLFAMFAFLGLFLLEKHWDWLAALSFSLAAATRSNGILLCGFLAFKWLLYVHDAHSRRSGFSQLLGYALKRSFITAVQCLIVLLPFAVYQYYAYALYCTTRRLNSFGTLIRNINDWCTWDSLLPPLHYSHVQSYYWSVGFLRYFEFKQIPNFLLATPMILLSVYCLVRFLAALMVVKRKEEKPERNWLRYRSVPFFC
jgi:phosphatidylinositol glycan class V